MKKSETKKFYEFVIIPDLDKTISVAVEGHIVDGKFRSLTIDTRGKKRLRLQRYKDVAAIMKAMNRVMNEVDKELKKTTWEITTEVRIQDENK